VMLQGDCERRSKMKTQFSLISQGHWKAKREKVTSIRYSMRSDACTRRRRT